MKDFVFDKNGFITNCTSTETNIFIPKETKGIRSLAFVGLPVKRLVFSHSVVLEEQCFVELNNLEIVDIRNVNHNFENFYNLEKSLLDTPLDVCLIVRDEDIRTKFENEAMFDWTCLFTNDEFFEPQFGGNDNVYVDGQALFKIDSLDDVCRLTFRLIDNIFSYFENMKGLYLPDKINGKEVVMGETSFRDIMKFAENIQYIKFFGLEDKCFKNYSRKYHLNFDAKNIHISRLDSELISFMDFSKRLKNLYIPSNISVLRGFLSCKVLQNVVFSNALNIKRWCENAFFDTPFSQTFDIKGKFKTCDDILVEYLGECEHDTIVRLPSYVRVIADKSFYKNVKFSYVDFGKVEYIGEEAFNGCTVERAQFSSNLKGIFNKAFAYSNIDVIDLPNSLEFVGKEAFIRNYSSWMDEERPQPIINYPSTAKIDEDAFNIIELELPFS